MFCRSVWWILIYRFCAGAKVSILNFTDSFGRRVLERKPKGSIRGKWEIGKRKGTSYFRCLIVLSLQEKTVAASYSDLLSLGPSSTSFPPQRDQDQETQSPSMIPSSSFTFPPPPPTTTKLSKLPDGLYEVTALPVMSSESPGCYYSSPVPSPAMQLTSVF